MSNVVRRLGCLGLLFSAATAHANAFDPTPVKVVSKHGARGAVFSPDGKTLLVYLVEGGVAAIDTATAKRGAFHKTEGGPALQLVPLGDGSRLIAGNASNQTIDTATGKTTVAPAWETLGRCDSGDHAVYGVLFPKGKEGALAVVDPTTGQAGRTVVRYATTNGTVPAQIAVDPDCKRVALFFGANPRREVIALFDLKTGKRLRDIKHDAVIGGVAWTRDGKQLLVGDIKGQLVHIDPATGKAVRKTKVSDDLVGTVRTLLDGTTLIGGSSSGTWLLRILHAETDALVQELPSSGCSPATDTAISADGNHIAVSCDRNTNIGVGTAVVIFHRQP